METEIQKVKDLFKSGQLYINEFMNTEHPSSDFPLIWKEMDEQIDYPFVASGVKKKGEFCLSITPEHIDFQCHDVSIDEHTDDVEKGIYFQLMVIALDDCSGGSYQDKRPVISYFGRDGKKHSVKLEYGTSIVFNPRKPHSVVYYGYKYTVAVRSVVIQ